VDPAQGMYYDNENPAKRETICRVAQASAADVDAAVRCAQQALEPGSPGRK